MRIKRKKYVFHDWEDVKKELELDSLEAQKGYEDARRASEFGELVWKIRTDAGITQAELAEKIGSTQPSIARIEGGGTTPTIELLERIAKAFGKKLEVTFKDANEKNSETKKAS